MREKLRNVVHGLVDDHRELFETLRLTRQHQDEEHRDDRHEHNQNPRDVLDYEHGTSLESRHAAPWRRVKYCTRPPLARQVNGDLG